MPIHLEPSFRSDGAGEQMAFGQNNNPNQYSCCSGVVVSLQPRVTEVG
jgi:hypothetical protein